MYTDAIMLLALSLVFGFVTDIADLLDEHGLHWFRGADIVFGLLWGTIGAFISVLYPFAGIYLLALVVYWLLRNKLDYINHALGGASILLTDFWLIEEGVLHAHNAIYATLMLSLLGYAGFYIQKRYLKDRNIPIAPSVIAYTASAAAISFMVGSVDPIIFSSVGMLGMKLSDEWFHIFEQNYSSREKKLFGLYVSK